MESIARHAAAASREQTARMTTAELRAHYHLGDLFAPGELHLAYTDLDRMAAGGAVPAEPLALPAVREFGTEYFLERRELGVFCLSGAGAVRAGAQLFALEPLDCLYIGMGEREVVFEPGAEYYLLSCPAHQRFPSRVMKRAEAVAVSLGDETHSNVRTIRKYIAPGAIESAQLSMGYTELAAGSVWNTMPPHTHARRMEIYLYFDLGGGVAVHLMGEPKETRSLIVREKEAALSPGWSIHCAAGTQAYKFVWGMAGENQSFSDMDLLQTADLL
jgi:4-deoxy-L-threo-5-hexosulose-uronate ketol-isomerase